MSKYCFQCGIELNDDDEFCGKCGANQLIPEPSHASIPQSQPLSHTYKTRTIRQNGRYAERKSQPNVIPKHRKKKTNNAKSVKVAVISIAVIILVCLSVFLARGLLSKNKGKSVETELSIDRVEEQLTNTYKQLWSDVYGAQKDFNSFSIQDFSIAREDNTQSFRGTVSLSDTGILHEVIGTATNERITELSSFIIIPDEIAHSLTEEEIIAFCADACFPACLFIRLTASPAKSTPVPAER